jgi:hypothetical protein
MKENAARECRKMADAYLNFIRRVAEEEGVACQLVSETDDQPMKLSSARPRREAAT